MFKVQNIEEDCVLITRGKCHLTSSIHEQALLRYETPNFISPEADAGAIERTNGFRVQGMAYSQNYGPLLVVDYTIRV